MCCFSIDQIAKLESIKTDLPEGTVDVEVMTEEIARPDKDARACSMDIVSIVGYLVGVQADKFGPRYKESVYSRLEQDENARIIRSLCSIRNGITHNPGRISKKLRAEITNIDKMPEFIDPAFFQYLYERNIKIITGSGYKDMTEYLAIINTHINNRINSCASLFPSWINFSYIKDMIVMPGGCSPKNNQAYIDKMGRYGSFFPYGCSINWPVEKPEMLDEFNYNGCELENANILSNDKKFCVLLYRVHGEQFSAFARVTDAGKGTKEILRNYLAENDRITMLVDCENSDPFKLCALFNGIRELRREAMQAGESLGSIRRVILFDDYHTIDAWDILSDYVSVEIIHKEVDRALDHKSLVDMAMAAGACREYYQEGVTGMIIASSDSDFWGVMRELPGVNFLAVTERTKFSSGTRSLYEENGVAQCFIDDFADNISGIRDGAINHSLEKSINNLITANLRDGLADVSARLHLDMTEAEQQAKLSELARSLRIEIGADGALRVKVA